MIYIVEKSLDYYADNGYRAIYASRTLEGAQVAVANFIEHNNDEEIYSSGYDEEERTWWCDTSYGMYQIIALPLND